jgi:hypothetical protein
MACTCIGLRKKTRALCAHDMLCFCLRRGNSFNGGTFASITVLRVGVSDDVMFVVQKCDRTVMRSRNAVVFLEISIQSAATSWLTWLFAAAPLSPLVNSSLATKLADAGFGCGGGGARPAPLQQTMLGCCSVVLCLSLAPTHVVIVLRVFARAITSAIGVLVPLPTGCLQSIHASDR